MKANTMLLVMALLALTGSAQAELTLPEGWVVGEPVAAAAVPVGEPACCALGRGHPCCVNQKRFDRSQPHQVEKVLAVATEQLPLLKLDGCVERKAGDPLPAAEHPASAFGLRVYAEMKPHEPLTHLARGEHVRMIPSGHVGAVSAKNAGVWWAGHTEAYYRSGGGGYGARYVYGLPWKRVDELEFDGVRKDGDALWFRSFEGSFDMVTGLVGASCAYEAALEPLLDEWVWGFRAERDGRQELHVLLPEADSVIAGRGLIASGSAYTHHVLPLDEAGALATRLHVAATDNWRQVANNITDVNYRGVISVHVTQAAGVPQVLVTKERSRSRAIKPGRG